MPATAAPEAAEAQARLLAKNQAATARNLIDQVRRWTHSAWFAYLMLALLQTKVIWGIFKYRDLASADSAIYFGAGYQWYTDLILNRMAMRSPLYIAYMGLFFNITFDAHLIIVLQRVIILFVVALLVLAVMRRLLPHGVAWLVAAWWASLPVVIDVSYAVHLFALIPVLVATLALLRKPQTPRTRGVALGILFVSASLVRTEMLLAAGGLAVASLGWEIWRARRAGRLPWRAYLSAYGTPMGVAAVIVLAFLSRQSPDTGFSVVGRQAGVFCQTYATAYRERYPEWGGNPWWDCSEIMAQDFGAPLPTFTEALLANPTAMAEHFLWNLQQMPTMVQIGLFNATSNPYNPDIHYHETNSLVARNLTVAAIGVCAAGLFLLARRRRDWWQRWLQARAWGWLALALFATSSLVTIIFLASVRDKYGYTITIALLALIGMASFVILDAVAGRFPQLKRLSSWMPLVMVAAVVLAPNLHANARYTRPRTMLEDYSRLLPFQSLLAIPDAKLLGPNSSVHCWYLAYGACSGLYTDFLDRKPALTPLETFLYRHGITMVYLDANTRAQLEADPSAQRFLTTPESSGWRQIAWAEPPDGAWMLFTRVDHTTQLALGDIPAAGLAGGALHATPYEEAVEWGYWHPEDGYIPLGWVSGEGEIKAAEGGPLTPGQFRTLVESHATELFEISN
ncbi:MAG: hypothetical protein M5R40_05945 [Anaerolineae bacterium]|nr:hypothetical protein [Anaerolineae bacterium]